MSYIWQDLEAPRSICVKAFPQSERVCKEKNLEQSPPTIFAGACPITMVTDTLARRCWATLCGVGVGGGGYCRWRKQGLATIGQEQLSLCVLLYVKILHLMVPPGVLGNKRRRGYTNCILRDRKQCSICLGFSKWIYYIVQWGLAWYSFFNTDNYCKHGYPWQYTHNKQFAVLYGTFFFFS